MGVHNFNKLKNKFEPTTKKQFDYIVIDGSNLLITFLSTSINELLEKYGKNIVDTPSVDILHQCVFVIKNTTNVVIRHVESLVKKYQAKEAYIVMDPIETPIYIINNDDEYVKKIFSDDIVNEDITEESIIKCRLKFSEQEKRRKYDDVDKCKQKITGGTKLYLNCDDDFKNYIKTNYDDPDEEFNKKSSEIVSLLLNTSLLTFQHQVIKLLPLTLNEMSSKLKNNEFIKLVRAKSEADLTIKCIASNMTGSVLVISKDTDYYVLFADMENVYCVEIGYHKPVYNPYSIWKQFLGEHYSYDYVIRISPIFGNDYTVHSKIIDCGTNHDDILSLFNFNGKLSSLVNNLRKTVGKLVNKFHKTLENKQSILKPEDIDEIIYKHENKFFKGYYSSVKIYSNWKVYGEYESISDDYYNNNNLQNLLKFIDVIYVFDDKYLKNKEWIKLLQNYYTVDEEDDKLDCFNEVLEEYNEELKQKALNEPKYSTYGGECFTNDVDEEDNDIVTEAVSYGGECFMD